MRSSVATVFSDFIVGTTAVYTSEEWNDPLGIPNKIALQAVADQVSGTGTITLTATLEHSCDQRNWVAKSGTAIINGETLSTSATTTLFGSDAGTTPNLGYVRVKLTLGGTTPQAHVKIHICGRDDA